MSWKTKDREVGGGGTKEIISFHHPVPLLDHPLPTYPYFLLNPGVLSRLLARSQVSAWETEGKSLLGRVTQNRVTLYCFAI